MTIVCAARLLPGLARSPRWRWVAVGAAIAAAFACTQTPQYDLIIRHGTVYDGNGSDGVVQDVGVQGNRIATVGDLSQARGREEVDATGLAVAPGFIDMLNHSETSLIADGKAQSGIRQGVTLAVFGESSMGPLNGEMKRIQLQRQGDIKYDIPWTTLGEYLDHLVTAASPPMWPRS